MLPHVGVGRHTLLYVARRSISTCNSSNGPVTAAYFHQVKSGTIRQDETQISLAFKLDTLHQSLASSDALVLTNHSDLKAAIEGYSLSLSLRKKPDLPFVQNPFDVASMVARQAQTHVKRALWSQPSLRGMYIYGSVGVGKSFCMDLFYNACEDVTKERGKRRAHFHEFMLDVHQRIHQFKKIHPRQDPIPYVALELAHEAQLLCFDEFQVTDIADALILKRLFSYLFHVGVVVVSTSNRPPDALYEGGLNRSLFLPFIDTLKERCDVISMDTSHDYRRDTPTPENDQLYSYFLTDNEPNTSIFLEQIFSVGGGKLRNEAVPVMMGRRVDVSRANDKCAWFDFKELCHQPLGAADYIALTSRFETIIIENVPQLGANRYNEARRFVTLIDAFYEARTRLVLSAQVPMEELFVDFEAKVETNDGDEEIAVEKTNVRDETWVSGEGGSSSSNSTTMVRSKNGENIEWSATGRVGVSLAQLSAVQEVAFSFRRAESRLAEMSGAQWGH